jgi:hypothetical protein
MVEELFLQSGKEITGEGGPGGNQEEAIIERGGNPDDH